MSTRWVKVPLWFKYLEKRTWNACISAIRSMIWTARLTNEVCKLGCSNPFFWCLCLPTIQYHTLPSDELGGDYHDLGPSLLVPSFHSGRSFVLRRRSKFSRSPAEITLCFKMREVLPAFDLHSGSPFFIVNCIARIQQVFIVVIG